MSCTRLLSGASPLYLGTTIAVSCFSALSMGMGQALKNKLLLLGLEEAEQISSCPTPWILIVEL